MNPELKEFVIKNLCVGHIKLYSMMDQVKNISGQKDALELIGTMFPEVITRVFLAVKVLQGGMDDWLINQILCRSKQKIRQWNYQSIVSELEKETSKRLEEEHLKKLQTDSLEIQLEKYI